MTRRKRCASTPVFSDSRKDKDIPGPFRCLTVNSPEGAQGMELVLEPMRFPPAQTQQKALFDAGIPATAFLTEDIQADFARLKERGVKFHGEPKSMGLILYFSRTAAAT